MNEEILDCLFEDLPQETLELISKSGMASFAYAMRTAARFHLGEPAIMKDPKLACQYAIHVICGRWVEAESVIAQNSYGSLLYFEKFKAGSEEMHRSIERGILKRKCPKSRSNRVYRYVHALGGRLPESLHSMMILSGERWYVEFIEGRERLAREYIGTLSVEERAKLIS